MKKTLAAGLLLLFWGVNANAVDFGIGVKAGINGVGLDLTVGLTETINLRLTGAAIDIDDEDETFEVGDDGDEADLDAELDFDYGANAVLLDWHLLDTGFRITAGMMKNNGEADISAQLTDDIFTGGEPLSPTDIDGDIEGELSLGDSYQPYVGIGWGRGAGGDGGFSISVDLGVALLDTDVDLEARVDAGGDNSLDQGDLNRRLREIEKDAEDELDDYELWPVFAFGVNYAF